MANDTTAQRYYEFLSSIAQHAPGHGSAIYIVWPEFVGHVLKPNQHLDPLRLFAQAGETADTLIDAMASCPGAEDFEWATPHLVQVSRLFKFERLGNPWGTVTEVLNAGTLTAIRAVASLFKSKSVHLTPSVDELGSIVALLDDLRQEVDAANIDEDVRDRLIGRIVEVAAAVNAAYHFGSTSLKRTLVTQVAEMVIEERDRSIGENEQRIRSRVLQIVSHIADFVGIAGFVLALGVGTDTPPPPPLPPAKNVSVGDGPVGEVNLDESEILDAEVVED